MFSNISIENSSAHFIGPSGSGKTVAVDVFRSEGRRNGVAVYSIATGDGFRALDGGPGAEAMVKGQFPNSLAPIFPFIASFMGAHIVNARDQKLAVAIFDGAIRDEIQIAELESLWYQSGIAHGVRINSQASITDAPKMAIRTPVPDAVSRIYNRARQHFAGAMGELGENREAQQVVVTMVEMLNFGLIPPKIEKDFEEQERQLSRIAFGHDKARVDKSLSALGVQSPARRDDALKTVVETRLANYALFSNGKWEAGKASKTAMRLGYYFNEQDGTLIENKSRLCFAVRNDLETNFFSFQEQVREVSSYVFAGLLVSQHR